MFALDTNTVIYYFKGLGRVGQRLLATAPSDVAIPSVVVFEIELGIARSTQPGKRRAQLDQILEVIPVLPLDRHSAKTAAEIEAELRSGGRPIGPMDTLIAAIALVHRATLVTHNTGEFRRVHGLTIEDWF